ncbi:uncharacterized protein LOC115419512 [Sphaeramia orbicularis]|uniref:uncharacterized protein LOC115419512 n=1 Tax=Sphaeramia orbicularis TaxID=375764 RepID=UPI0011813B7F|nr:uncharacterized protein LOC115419512 [Sphaeramia orbicularis]
MGSDVTLCCRSDKLPKVLDWRTLTVEWKMVDKHSTKKTMYTFVDGAAHVTREGAVVDELNLLRGDASLQLRNVTLADDGEYTCRVITPVVDTFSTTLEVLARPSVSLPEEVAVPEGEEKMIQCDIRGFYPQKLTVTWHIQNASHTTHAGANKLYRVCTEMAAHNSDGTYSIRSGITLPSSAMENREIRLICQVEHQTYISPYRRTVTLTVQAPSQLQFSIVKLVAVTSVVSLLLVVSVIGGALLLYRYFCRKAKWDVPPIISEISQPSVVLARVENELKCSIRGAGHADLTVRWYKLGHGDDPEAQTEDTALLDRTDVSEQARLESDGRRHMSILSVCLTITEDRTRYQCEVQWRQETIIRETTVRVNEEPSFLQITSIPQIPRVERLLVLCCRVENFYPQDVHLEWSRNDGEKVGKVMHFGPFSDHSRHYSMWSKIQLTMAREDERAVYTCRVYHPSYPSPGFKDVCYHINTQGTPPDVMFINCEPPEPQLNEECTLHLCIKDFCPETVTVTWTKDGELVQSGVFNTPPSLNTNGLYSMFSFLKFSPDKDDCGSMFRCQVEHSAQKELEQREFILTPLIRTQTQYSR